MPEIVESVRAALQPRIAAEVVSDVRMAGLVSADGRFKPLMSVSVAGERPEAQAAEISRMLKVAGLDVQWSLTLDRASVWPKAMHLVP